MHADMPWGAGLTASELALPHSNALLPTNGSTQQHPVLATGAGQHVGGSHPNGKGAGVERHGARPRVLLLLLGLLAHTDPRRLGVHQVG